MLAAKRSVGVGVDSSPSESPPPVSSALTVSQKQDVPASNLLILTNTSGSYITCRLIGRHKLRTGDFKGSVTTWRQYLMSCQSMCMRSEGLWELLPLKDASVAQRGSFVSLVTEDQVAPQRVPGLTARCC